ncbi:hypothetical protein LSAT2_021051 [Lamellibrachia satsuma]|nr:hypothetical protein LSAT2_021051 [Lamellibrachia satsuma]
MSLSLPLSTVPRSVTSLSSTTATSTRVTPRRGTTRDPRCNLREPDVFRTHIIDPSTDPATNPEHQVEERALCNFEYTADIDRHRHPEIMVVAVCPTKNCGHCAGGQGRCEPVYHNFKVLRRCGWDNDNNYLYRYDYERLAVACVCATPALEEGKPFMPAGSANEHDDPAPVLD